MTPHVWEDLLTARDEQVVSKAGDDREGASSENSRGRGASPVKPVSDEHCTAMGEGTQLDRWTSDAAVRGREGIAWPVRGVAR